MILVILGTYRKDQRLDDQRFENWVRILETCHRRSGSNVPVASCNQIEKLKQI